MIERFARKLNDIASMRDSEIKHCQSWREHYYATEAEIKRRGKVTVKPPQRIDMHEAIVAERCETFRYCCIVGCQNDKRRVETSGGATGVGGTNPGMPQQRSLRKRMVPAARCYNNTPGKFLRHPSFFCGSSNPAKLKKR